jgi:hypothetical protein
MQGLCYYLALQDAYSGIFTDRSKIAMGKLPKLTKIIHSKSNPERGKGDYPCSQKQINAKLISCHAYHISKIKNKGAARQILATPQSNFSKKKV